MHFAVKDTCVSPFSSLNFIHKNKKTPICLGFLRIDKNCFAPYTVSENKTRPPFCRRSVFQYKKGEYGMKTVKISLNSIDAVKSFVNTVSKYDSDFDLVSGRYVIHGYLQP